VSALLAVDASRQPFHDVRTTNAMSIETPSCTQCRVPMERGFRLDLGHRSFARAAKWVEGDPVASMWTGLKLRNSTVRQVVSYRCPQCGVLVDFARNRTSHRS
jgi:hypothetical protein